MESLELLNKKVKTSQDLLSLVKTMKSLAAVNVRQYEAAATAMDEYTAVIGLAWQVLFKNRPRPLEKQKSNKAVLLVLGSDQGMCGQFNENIIKYSLQQPGLIKEGEGSHVFWAAGERVRAALAEEAAIEEHFYPPSSPAAISDLIHEIVRRFARKHENEQVNTFRILYNRLERGGIYSPVSRQILPLEPYGQEITGKRKWPSRCLPMIRMDNELFFKELFRQHIFGEIYKAFCQSLASENTARLVSMQRAEKNIMEMEEDLQGRFRETRQNAITAELLDIISGFEALAPC